MPSPNNELTADSYIQDGLVFQLDGIEYGGIDGQWIDRKDGIIAQLNHKVSHINNKYFKFEKEGQALFDKEASFSRNNYTIDFVGTVDSSYANLFCPFKNQDLNTICLGTYSQAPGYLGYGANNISSIPRNIGLILIHFQSGRFVNKGQIIRASASFVSLKARNAFGINSIYNSSYSGIIYTIRCYSRKLSDREILINQKIDNARFELGLNIPDEVQPASRSLSLLEPFELPDESESEQEPTNETSDER